jgi:hypothetical protein
MHFRTNIYLALKQLECLTGEENNMKKRIERSKRCQMNEYQFQIRAQQSRRP